MEEQTYLAMVHFELDRAYRLAGLLLGRGGDAEDATHDAVLRGWRYSSSLRDPERFQAWFDRIVINICRDRLRRARRIRFVDLGDASGIPTAEDPFDWSSPRTPQERRSPHSTSTYERSSSFAIGLT